MDEAGHQEPRRGPIIEPNGSEYLVMLNGSVFLALTFAAAERMARRMRGSSPASRTAVRLPLAGGSGVLRR